MTTPGSTSLLLAVFNTAALADAERDVARCCASRSLAMAIAAGRPYDDFDALEAAIDAEFTGLGWADTAEALANHPRIGDQHVSGWSQAEQAGVGSSSSQVADELAAGNRAYEERFGHV